MKVIRGRGVEIRINAPILSDPQAFEAACSEALAKVAEAVHTDVTSNRDMIFADTAEDSRFPTGKYPNANAYYGSGKVPVYSRWLLDSFQSIGTDGPFVHLVAFTASYAGKIEKGGGFGTAPREWAMEKIDKDVDEDIIIYSTHPHPFAESVRDKIDANMMNYDYLNIFSTAFVASIKG